MKAVVTISIGDKFHRIAELTHPRMERYAQSIGADFISLNRFVASPHLEKFRLSDFLAVYDRILFLDTDIVINKNCPDIFTQVAEDRFGAWFPDAMIPGRFSEQIKRVQAVLGEIGWAKDYFNSGVMVISRIHRPIFAAPPNYSDEFYEQTLLNYRVQQ